MPGYVFMQRGKDPRLEHSGGYQYAFQPCASVFIVGRRRLRPAVAQPRVAK